MHAYKKPAFNAKEKRVRARQCYTLEREEYTPRISVTHCPSEKAREN